VTYDATAAYRTVQVSTSSPGAQVVLLYEGAIRYSAQFVQRQQAGDLEGAHTASIRAQAIVSALRESLDLSAGEVALQLDAIYDFVGRRLVAGNMAKQAGPALEAITLLRDLLEAWRTIAAPASDVAPAAPARTSRPLTAVPVSSFAAIRA
jgi:flagellar protein FliS